MPLNLKQRLAIALLGVALLSHPVLAAKIDRFKDDGGTLHITNLGEATSDKPGTGTMPVRRRVSQAEALSQEASPHPQALITPPPGTVPLPPQEATPRPEATPPSQALLPPPGPAPPPPPGSQPMMGHEADPNSAPPEGRFGRSRGGGRR